MLGFLGSSRFSLQFLAQPGGRHEAQKDFDIVKFFCLLKMLKIIYKTDAYTGILLIDPELPQK